MRERVWDGGGAGEVELGLVVGGWGFVGGSGGEGAGARRRGVGGVASDLGGGGRVEREKSGCLGGIVELWVEGVGGAVSGCPGEG